MAAEWENDVSNLVLLSSEHLESEDLCRCLKERYRKDTIYTYIDNVLVAINPFRSLDIYSPQIAEQYRGKRLYEKAPHLFALADVAYRQLLRSSKDVCILVTGENCSGKTVSCKIILLYYVMIVECSRSLAEARRLRKLFLQVGPLLDAFGNAAVVRNDNSSRFGKSVSITVDFRGHLLGGHIRNFLLERSRVTTRSSGNRNFHIFYQLVRGASDKLMQALQLKRDASSYAYLKPGDQQQLPNVNDKNDFKFVESAMALAGIKPEEQREVWKALAAILHLGQVKFECCQHGVGVLNLPLIEVVASLLSVPFDDLEMVLCFRRIYDELGGVIEQRLTVEDAVRQRNLFAQAVYVQVFDWLVYRLNTLLQPVVRSSDPVSWTTDYDEGVHSISIVDMYGFEKLEASSFEHMCINYCAEKMQQLFLWSVLIREQDLYIKEDLPWQYEQFNDNANTCELFDDPQVGIYTFLDRATGDELDPESSDKAFLDLMDENLDTHPGYSSRQVDPGDAVLCPFLDFKIVHFASPVTYTISGFVSKNRHALDGRVKELFSRSQNQVLQGVEVVKTSGEVTPGSTIGVEFRNLVRDLVESIKEQETYHVRCIKPNDTRTPNYVDEARVCGQIDSMALREAVLVRRKGYKYHLSYEEFFQRYHVLCRETWPPFHETSKAGCRKIIADRMFSDSDSTVFGRTRLFFRFQRVVDNLEQMREKLVCEGVVRIQRAWRRHLVRRRIRWSLCSRRISRCYRNYQVRTLIYDLLDRYGQRSPAVAWPSVPRKFTPLLDLAKKCHRRQHFSCILDSISPEKREFIRLKVFGYEALSRRRHEWGCKRSWIGNYLAETSIFCTQIDKLMKQWKFNEILFSARVVKLSSHLKTRDRCLVISESSVLLLDPTHGYVSKKAPLQLEKLSDVWVTPGHDQLIMLRFKNSEIVFALTFPDLSNDFIGELVATLCRAVDKNYSRQLTVNVSPNFEVNLAGTAMTLAVDYQFQLQPRFEKTSQKHIYLIWPAR